MQKTPRGLRLQIGIFGRRNAGKSSFVNQLTRQKISIVSDIAGTTTDPVEKAMELLPIGPVLFIDTAGIDDAGALGEMRVNKSRKIFERSDIAVLITEAGNWDEFEISLLDELANLNIPLIVVFNKCDLNQADENNIQILESRKIPYIKAVSTEGKGINEFREILIQAVPDEYLAPKTIAGDLLNPGEMAILVVPIDLEAPKGRLILPQVQTIRDLLDNDSYCMIAKERELKDAIENLKKPPKLIITDSQAFLKVADDTPADVLMTSFSILFARFKGDLKTFAEGALAIEKLKSGDKVLIAEACTHHPIGEDIGRVKIPRWLSQYAGGKIHFDFTQGHDFPDNISPYNLIIHCGSCTFNRRQLISRLEKCRRLNIPVTNYGVAIAYSLGIFERALAPFPEAMEAVKRYNL